MQEVAPPPQPPAPEVAWTDYVDTVLRWWRFVVYGCLAGWVLVLLGALLIPRDYECTASLALPTINPKQKKQEMAESGVPLSVLRELDKEDPKPGVPLATYKRLEKRLGDEAVLTAALRDLLSPRKIRRVIRDFSKHVSAITTNPRNDVERMTKDDTITGVQVYFEGHPEAHARAVVTALSGLVRDAFVTTMVLDQIESQTVRASVDSIQAMGESLNFLAENDSLALQADAVSRLSRESPGASGSPREVVDVKEGGYRYLPPPTQLVGIRATEAYNAHKARLRAREAKLARLRLDYFSRLDERLRAEFLKAGRQVVADPPAVMREELGGFLQGKAATDPEVAFVRQEIEGMAEMIATFGRGTRSVQLPTAKARPRALPALAAALAVPLLLMAAALVAESWKRYHAARGVATRAAA